MLMQKKVSPILKTHSYLCHRVMSNGKKLFLSGKAYIISKINFKWVSGCRYYHRVPVLNYIIIE